MWLGSSCGYPVICFEASWGMATQSQHLTCTNVIDFCGRFRKVLQKIGEKLPCRFNLSRLLSSEAFPVFCWRIHDPTFGGKNVPEVGRLLRGDQFAVMFEKHFGCPVAEFTCCEVGIFVKG